MMRHFEEVQALIVEDEWYNIPACIKKTCEGIIAFSEKLTQRILTNSEGSNRKVILMEHRVSKIEGQMKGKFDLIDSKFTRDIKKM